MSARADTTRFEGGGIVAIEVDRVGEQTWRAECAEIFRCGPSHEDAARAAAVKFVQKHRLTGVEVYAVGGLWLLHWKGVEA